MEITGLLKVKNNEVQVSEKFKKREFVITDNSSQYPQFIQFQLTQDRCSLLDSYKEGDELKVFFNLRGREWKNPQGEVKYFNSLEAWRLESVSSSNNNQNNTQNNSAGAKAVPALDTQADDLPF
jgi:hypothetical protein